jgi:hypothetical protein
LTIEVLTDKEKSATMSKLHKGSKNIGANVESKEGERGPLCSNKANVRSPSLVYTYIPSSENLDKAFDLLFEEVIRNNHTNLWKQKD